jgi:hypothetical protein
MSGLDNIDERPVAQSDTNPALAQIIERGTLEPVSNTPTASSSYNWTGTYRILLVNEPGAFPVGDRQSPSRVALVWYYNSPGFPAPQKRLHMPTTAQILHIRPQGKKGSGSRPFPYYRSLASGLVFRPANTRCSMFLPAFLLCSKRFLGGLQSVV